MAWNDGQDGNDNCDVTAKMMMKLMMETVHSYIIISTHNYFLYCPQLMTHSGTENLQVALACQVTQKNTLIGAVKQATLCYWAQYSEIAEVQVVSSWALTEKEKLL